MGAWGIHTFEDDHNVDWLDDLVEQDEPLEFFRECLDLEEIEELDYTAGTGVLCTAVVIDALLNGPTKDLPPAALKWIEQHRQLDVAEFVPDAIAGIERLLGDDSEMNELWRENDQLYPAWSRRIMALKNRLRQVGQA